MSNRTFVNRLLIVIVSSVLHCGTALADYNQMLLLSTEWLVANSDVVAIVRSSPGSEEGPEAVTFFKGDETKLTANFDEKKYTGDGYFIFQPSDGGKVKIVFFSEEKGLLQSVQLDRDNVADFEFLDNWYGVDEFGRLLMTQSELFHSVGKEIQRDNGKPVSRIPRAPFRSNSAVEARKEFPMETTSETFVIVVPFDEHRRDAVINLAVTGTGFERKDAIRELSFNDDEKSVQAIKRIASGVVNKLVPSVGRDPDGTVSLIGEKDIQEFAQQRIDWLRSR